MTAENKAHRERQAARKRFFQMQKLPRAFEGRKSEAPWKMGEFAAYLAKVNRA